MVPPEEIFGIIPNWLGVFLVSGIAFALAGFVLYWRVVRMVLLGRSKNRFDQPLLRIWGLVTIVLGQARVPVLTGDTPDSLAARVLAQEHILYPMVLRRFAEGNRAPLYLP